MRLAPKLGHDLTSGCGEKTGIEMHEMKDRIRAR
jgi:hypothetical protein